MLGKPKGRFDPRRRGLARVHTIRRLLTRAPRRPVLSVLRCASHMAAEVMDLIY